ncbi:SpoIIE family protein phosphatase [Streptomyces sp. V4-01]|uniref:SpoIIE family protein phosphatase n=1 Tax=Actinacidiphila polyblastidii TaxID=3110430 RepID=A0ABU7PHP4_9ACTN|nr:SpoIIE family protein phosphatase [Streptomyces sp. V4-01]
MDETTRPPSATDSDQHTDRPAGHDQRDAREAHSAPALRGRSRESAPRSPAGDDGTDQSAPRTGAGGAEPSHDPDLSEDVAKGAATKDPVPCVGPGAAPAAAPAHTSHAPTADFGVAAVLRLAVLCVDPDGRISYWNRGAEELFGHRWEQVFGHRASGLLTALRPSAGPGGSRSAAAHQDTLDLLDDLTDPAWAGALAATDRDGTLRDVLWWTYRLVEPAGRSLLAIAAHAKPLRTGSLRIALGGRMLPYTAEGPQRQDVSVAAVLDPAADPARGHALVARLGSVLPGVSPGRLDRVVQQIVPLGHPVLEVDASTRLPVVPHDYVRAAAAARAERGARRELLPGPRLGRPTAGGPAAGGGNGVDLSSAAALTAVPAPQVTPFMQPRSAQSPGGGLISDADALAYRDGVDHDPLGPDAAGTGPGLSDRDLLGPDPLGRDPLVRREALARPGPLTAHGPVGADQSAAEARTRQEPVIPATGTALDEQLALLRAAGAVVGSTLDLETTARELCAVTVPRFADFAAVLVADQLFSDTEPPLDDKPGDTVLVRRVATAFQDLPGSWETVLPEGELLTLPTGEVVPRLGDPVLVPVVDPALAPDIALDLGVPALGPLLSGHSLIVTPLTARGTVLGRAAFLRGPGRPPFDQRDAATAAEVVARGAVHIDNARLHRLESRAAATLQRSMMPTKPPRLPGVRIAHHYMPGDRQAQVGGDWFDAIQLPGGRVALIVGDVMGHGLQAAAVMGQFRTAVITMAGLDLPPAQLLRHLDNLAHRLGPEHLATCVYAVYDPIHRHLTLANAGHIPPVLAGYDGRSELLEIPGGAPIGVGGVPFETVEVKVPDGSWLVLCTDGLVEVRGQGIDAGLAALCSHVIEPEQTPEDVCAQILARVHSEDRRDDVALLVARFEGIAPEDVVHWTLRLDHEEVGRARDLTRRQLATWGLERLTETTELLVSELVTNAIRAASYEVELRLMRVGKLLVEVSDDNHNLPQLQRAEGEDEEGRGLALVSHLSRRWGTSRKAVGKVVWFELRLPG